MSFLKNIKTPDDLVRERNDQLAKSIRSKRNQLIADTDYMVMPDYPITSEQLIAVQAYRQELRDITNQEGFPNDVVFPVNPFNGEI